MAFLLVLAVTAGPARAEDILTGERRLGSPDAPVTMIEYSSLTCPHCATFHSEILPTLKKDYIDTGKVLYVFRDFPLDGRAAAASMTARCVDPARYFAFVDLLYRDQNLWARSNDPLAELAQRARLTNLPQADFDACLENEALLAAIQQRAREGEQAFGIDSTPTFVINDEVIRGAAPLERFREVIDAATAQSKPASE